MLGSGAPVATQGPSDAVPRKPASSLLSVPCPAGVCLLCSLRELAGALEHGSPPVPSPRPFGGSVPQVTLLPGDSTWPALAVRARLASQLPVPAYGGKSWVTPGLWTLVHSVSPESSSWEPRVPGGWALFPALWLRQCQVLGGSFTLTSSPMALFPYSVLSS